MKVIITGSTGMVGEGVLLECLEHPAVTAVLMVNRRSNGFTHPKLKELVIPDFFKIQDFEDQLKGYDACFYCAGISSNGMTEADYTRITVDTTLHFANVLVRISPQMIFSHISGSHTDGTEKSKVMWARVKGRAENELMRLPFKRVYNFRPGFMEPTEGQKNIKSSYKIVIFLSPLLKLFFPALKMKQVGMAMINSVSKGYDKQVLEIKDIRILAE